jgi:hypothetical protein
VAPHQSVQILLLMGASSFRASGSCVQTEDGTHGSQLLCCETLRTLLLDGGMEGSCGHTVDRSDQTCQLSLSSVTKGRSYSLSAYAVVYANRQVTATCNVLLLCIPYSLAVQDQQ